MNINLTLRWRHLAAGPMILGLLFLSFGFIPTMMLFGGGERPDTWVIALSPFFVSGVFASVALFLYALEGE